MEETEVTVTETPEPKEEIRKEDVEPVMEKVHPIPDKKTLEEAQRNKKATAYGTALAVMGSKPLMDLRALYDVMRKNGFDLKVSGNSIKTAHSNHKKVLTYLRMNGFIKESKLI